MAVYTNIEELKKRLDPQVLELAGVLAPLTQLADAAVAGVVSGPLLLQVPPHEAVLLVRQEEAVERLHRAA